MGEVGNPDGPGHKAIPLAVIGGDLVHVAPGALFQPVLQLTGDKLVGVVAGPVRQIDDEAVAVGDVRPLGIGAPDGERHVAAPAHQRLHARLSAPHDENTEDLRADTDNDDPSRAPNHTPPISTGVL